jgi:hypothetical protein
MQQMREAFPWDEAPRYVLRDRDTIYGRGFAAMTRDMPRLFLGCELDPQGKRIG